MEFHSFVAAAAAAAATVAQRRRDSFFSSTEEGRNGGKVGREGREGKARERVQRAEFVVERITPQFIGQNLQCLVSPGEEGDIAHDAIIVDTEVEL